MKECENYLDGFCIKDIDAGRVWDCTAKGKKARLSECKKIKEKFMYFCKYPKLGRETYEDETR